jgi:hypothetical protein
MALTENRRKKFFMTAKIVSIIRQVQDDEAL